MAVVFKDPNNSLICYRHDRSDEQRFPLPPNVDNGSLVRFDKETNPDLFKDLQSLAASGRYTIEENTLKKDGVPVSINTPGTFYNDGLLVAQLDDDIADLTSPLTLVQLQPILRRGLRILRYYLKRTKEIK